MTTTLIISPLGTTTLIERHYDSQQALARYVMQSWTGSRISTREPLWRQYDRAEPGQDALYTKRSLHQACNRFHGILDEACTQAMAAVNSIAEQIGKQIRLLPSLDVHRKRTQGRNGYALNIHKVNRGQLSTAWKRTVREHRVGETGTVTLVLCTDYSSDADDETAIHTQAATLALARKIEETGRRVEIWASILTHNAHTMRKAITGPGCPHTFDELDHLVLKRADEDLSGPALAALCSLSLVRQTFFQVWRMQLERIGPIDNYGEATNKHQVYQALVPYFTRQGIPLASVHMGADETDRIRDIPKAIAWCEARIQALVPQGAGA